MPGLKIRLSGSIVLPMKRITPTKTVNWSLSTWLCFSSGLVMLLTFAILGLVFYFVVNKTMYDDAMALLKSRTSGTASELNSRLDTGATIIDGLAVMITSERPTRDELMKTMVGILTDVHKNYPEISGLAVTAAPGHEFSDFKGMLYACFDGDGREILTQSFPDPSYFEHESGYQLPYQTHRKQWTEPYYDAFANYMMTTYTAPLLWEEGNGEIVFHGIVSVDISLEFLRKAALSIPSHYPGSRIGVVTGAGNYLVSPHINAEDAESDVTSSDDMALLIELLKTPDDKAMEIKIPDGIAYTDDTWYVEHSPISATGYHLIMALPKQAITGRIIRLESALLGMSLVGLILMTATVWFTTHRGLKPLAELRDAVRAAGQGDLLAPLPVNNARDEIGELTRGFEKMQHELGNYFQRLSAAAAEKEGTRRELMVAAEIQRWILPGEEAMKRFRGEAPAFEVAGAVHPARGVGGDLFDCLRGEDGDGLWLTVGDVSGKGVAAALFMVACQIFTRAGAERASDPGELLTRVNRLLLADNRMGMFVTSLILKYDEKTGEAVYGSAGHNPALLLHPDGGMELLDRRHGPPLGAAEFTYGSTRTRLTEGDMLILYTDGVTEAFNPEEKLFGLEGLKRAVTAARASAATPEAMMNAIFEAVERHADGAEQSDDITLLILKRTSAA